MRVRTLEIRWHDSKPISTCDFQPLSFRKARPAQDRSFAGQSYRLATGGEDNHVRLWMVYPNILPQSMVGTSASSNTPIPRPPRVEYLATLSRHSASVNVVRFSPNGDLIASAGDDGMIIVWAQTVSPQTTSYGSDISPEDMQYEKEHWKPRTTFRCTTMQVYDLAWSPTGEHIIAGSTDNCARVFTSSEGKCIHEIAEHSHFVQGVAWDPFNEYIATQSSDRSMHIYSISHKQGGLEFHAIGKNSRIPYHHSRTPSQSRPRLLRRESTASETESIITSASEKLREETFTSTIQASNPLATPTPTASVPSTPAVMFPPPLEKSSSRRSSFSGSNAPGSPANSSRYARSPSPMPALPAIRMLPAAASNWRSLKLYGDESYTNFFRRLTFSPDGGLLLTPAGQFEDPSVVPGSSKVTNNTKSEEQSTRGRKGNPSSTLPDNSGKGSFSSVYIYTRANFTRPPVARLPGHKKASVAVKFSPILYELRPGVTGVESASAPHNVLVERGREESTNVDIGGSSVAASSHHEPPSPMSPMKTLSLSSSINSIVSPSPRVAASVPQSIAMPSPALSATDSLRPPTPVASKPATPAIITTGSIFALPYRMLYAVATMDTVTIYDTQQAGPVCMLSKLHYDEFTDMTWSPDGQCLILSSRDGYCTLVIFDEILPAYHIQQHTLQLQSIAHHHSLPLTSSSAATPSATPSLGPISLPSAAAPPTPVSLPPLLNVTSMIPTKRPAESPLTPDASVDDSVSSVIRLPEKMGDSGVETSVVANDDEVTEPPKKKRRAALTRVGDIGS